ncbi:hypothetical protein BPOR_0097g00060 [Botrytis porri]|uniref:Uncharacterized protein n=1 Tax=Botrytis porri TaxID=87229 RepID=A0A4Z1KYS6_9HELO|nr:hypothetical protein BPOR_0097g00060 [Botrytis porri]
MVSNYKSYGNIRRRNPNSIFFEGLFRRDLNGRIAESPFVKQWNTGNAVNDSNIEDSDTEDGITGPSPCIMHNMRARLHTSALNKTKVDW